MANICASRNNLRLWHLLYLGLFQVNPTQLGQLSQDEYHMRREAAIVIRFVNEFLEAYRTSKQTRIAFS
jgi:hypothetical protein